MEELLLGLRHITDPGGYDHMLYLLALMAWAEWKHLGRLALLATAFTVGHSLTLVLAGLEWVHPDPVWVEFLIPLSIVVTAVANARERAVEGPSAMTYGVTVGFGLVHGLGFSTFFRIASDPGEGIVGALLRFNLGVEAGQILILTALLGAVTLAGRAGIPPRTRQLFLTGAAAGPACILLLERLPL
jgi:hypothetical protein